MKTNRLFSVVTKMACCPLVLAFACLFAFSTVARSQESASSSGKSSAIYPTFGFGIGFFYPGDVNDYIEEELVAGTIATNTELYMYLEVKGGLTFRLKQVDFSALLEYDIAPKFVVVSGGGDDFSYSYSRISPEISANYYIPGKSGKNAFFIGGGINYSFMKFEDFSASAPGVKVQLGYSMQFGKFNLQPYVAFRYTKATDDSDAIWGTMDEHSDITLDYIGGQLGLILSFHPRILYN